MIEVLTQLFQHDLEKLRTEISSYKDENKMWEMSGELKNSAGNLCLHICGNLQHFIGATLGNSGYIRKREAEFSRKNVPLKELVDEIELTTKVVEKTLKGLKEEDLQKTFPINVFGHEMTTGFFLVHLTTHLNYHLGQINYHRRLLDF
ncbi:MAG: DinB family protein [Ignavibacteriaceae bacterium]|nr:DinB family protein [Ignavibacteriaceae bacterium]